VQSSRLYHQRWCLTPYTNTTDLSPCHFASVFFASVASGGGVLYRESRSGWTHLAEVVGRRPYPFRVRAVGLYVKRVFLFFNCRTMPPPGITGSCH